MSFLSLQGERHSPAVVPVFPDSALATTITTMKNAGTIIENRLMVRWDLGEGNGYVDLAANDEIPHGRVQTFEKDRDTTWLLGMEVWGYDDGAGTFHGMGCIVDIEYGESTIAVTNSVNVNGSTGLYVEGAASGTAGCILWKDTGSGKVTVIF